jgi:NAD(P)-dependent dehydrogenase (short-subunit alcohol dehydrogenase family)
MAHVFITGSADGLGQLTANQLVKEGHQVVLHARNIKRGKEAIAKVPGAETVLTADLSSIEETKLLAVEANKLGNFDAIIHNAGVYNASGDVIFTVNTLAPYILTCLMSPPKRLIYLSSGLHMQGNSDLDDLQFNHVTYADSKLHINILTMAVARKWSDIYTNAVNPGWVPTKMGGAGAPDSLQKGYETQAWLATSDDPQAKVTGQYFFHQRPKNQRTEANDVNIQERFITMYEGFTDVHFPSGL